MKFCFDCNFIECNSIEDYKVKDIINTFLLPRDKCMPEIDLLIVPVDHLLRDFKEILKISQEEQLQTRSTFKR